MDRDKLDPFATKLVAAYLDTAVYSRTFKEDYGQPPTVMAKVQHLRAVVQAGLAGDDRFILDPDYMEFGRVQVDDRLTGRAYLLRSHSAVSIENRKRAQDANLFPGVDFVASDVLILVYRFDKDGMALDYTGSRRRAGRKRLEPSGPPEHVGLWSYTMSEPPPFDQGAGYDPFEEVGDIDLDGEADEQ